MGGREPAGHQENDDGDARGEEDWQAGRRKGLGDLDVMESPWRDTEEGFSAMFFSHATIVK